MITPDQPQKDWRCLVSRHSYVERDDHPDMYGRPSKVCFRCGSRVEQPPEEPVLDIERKKRRGPFFGGHF